MSAKKVIAFVSLVPCLALGAEWNITPGHWSWKAGVDNVDELPGSGNLVNDVRVAGCVDAVGECSPTLWIWTSDEEWSQIVGDGGSAFADIASGTNTTAAMVVGSGSSISLTGTGTVEATSLLTPSAAAYVGGLGLDFRSTDLANSLGTLGFLSAGLLGTNAEEVRFDSNSDVTIRPKDTSGKSVDLLVSAANNTSSGAGGALILRGGTSVSGTAGITILQGCVQYGARSTSPSSPTPGECDTYYNTASDKLCTHNGSVWVCGGAPTFDEIDSGTNTTAAMVVGTGASLSATGSGTITATTSAALAANAANCSAGQAAAGVDASGAAEGCTAYLQGIGGEDLGDLANVSETGADSGEALVSDGAGSWAPSAAAVCLSNGTNCPSSSASFSAITSGTNTTAAMTLGSGASLTADGAAINVIGVAGKLRFFSSDGASLPVEIATDLNGFLRFYRNGTLFAQMSNSSFGFNAASGGTIGGGGAFVAHTFNGDLDTGVNRDATTGGVAIIDESVPLLVATTTGDDHVAIRGCKHFGAMAAAPAVTSPSECDMYVDTDDGSGNAALCVYLDGAWVKAAGAGVCP